MKKVKVLFVLLVVYVLGYSQNQIGNSPIHYLNGKVGIGVDNPSDLLHLKHPSLYTFLRLERTDSGKETGISFWTGNSNDYFIYSDNSTGNPLQIIASGLSGENDAYPRIRIPKTNKDLYLALSGGNVGIGTTTPNANLEVRRDFNGDALIRVWNNSNYSGTRSKVSSGRSGYSISMISTSANYSGISGWSSCGIINTDSNLINGLILRSAAGGIRFQLSSTSDNIVFKPNGNVGIGTSDPKNKLHLYNSTGNTFLRLDRVSGEAGISFCKSGEYNFFLYSDNVNNNALQIQAYGLSGEDDNNPRMRIPKINKDLYFALSGGNVGVGTTNTHGYKLAVDGKMIVEEVVVKMSENWPDFVFANDYNLKPLEEVEDFVNENKHLPGIPSEEEAKDGVGLAEMNKKLLQKVEELTLYMIEMNKENKELRKRVEKLEEK